MRRKVEAVFAEFGHAHIDVNEKVANFDFSTRQVIEIVKAFALADLLEIEMPVMLLDEPTAALTGDEVTFLMKLIAKARARAAIIYVSHRLTEVLEVSDHLYVLKDGAVVASIDADGVADHELHERMVGRKREEFFYSEQLQREPTDKPIMVLKDLSLNGAFSAINMSLNAGEIVGIAGILGSGKSDLARALAGDMPGTIGTIEIDGQRIGSPSIATMCDAGLGYLPPDRRDGVIPVLSVAINMTLARLTRHDESVILDLTREEAEAQQLIGRLSIKTPGVHAHAGALSGGNQQKVLLARWLLRDCKVLVLDNPTNGVDAGAKEEIYAVIRSIADSGVGIVVVSDDLPEVIGLSNRVMVMRAGKIIHEIAAPGQAKPNEVDVVAHMV